MPETIEKLRPDRDLQCYYYDQSAIAAFSETSPTGFTLSGSWRQQFDWAVVEWNRDNVFEHPAFRTLPDSDLSGLVLTYDEERENCMPIDSDLAETVSWKHLRIWVREEDGSEEVYFVPLKDHAEAIEGDYESAYAEFTLSGSAIIGDHIGLAYSGQEFPTGLLLGQNFTREVGTTDLAWEAQTIVDGINGSEFSVMKAERSGTTIKVYYTADAPDIAGATTGANGNKWGLIAYSDGAAEWDAPGKMFANGVSPSKWRITLDFSDLWGFRRNELGESLGMELIPTDKIRKIRWTYAADQQMEEFERSDFKVTVSNWTVTGTGRTYSVAGRGSRRIEENDPSMHYSGDWSTERGNYSGGMIRRSSAEGDSVTLNYFAPGTHTLYVGTRYTDNAAEVAFTVDGDPAGGTNLRIPEEDVLVRWKLGEYGSGSHTVTVIHTGDTGEDLWIDFVEIAVPDTELPTFPSMPTITVATDWDTLHSVAIAPERTAWMLHSMGFHGRQNHYVGALLFYELYNQGNAFASKTITFSGTPEPGKIVRIEIGPIGGEVIVERTVQPGETLETIALSFAQNFNRGYTLFRAEASGGSVTVYARQLGDLDEDDERVTFTTYSESTTLAVSPESSELEDGVDGVWRTDLEAEPRLNRAMRDWTRSFLAALDDYGIDAACAFSTEIKHGDPSVEAGIAQRDYEGDPFILPTPALQTNFSPTSLAFWKQVHADCAQMMDEAGLVPYLQFGEEQWWYFPHNGFSVGHPQRVDFASMPFYDAWTLAEFEDRYSHALAPIFTNDVDPLSYPDEVEFLADILGEFTDAVIAYVRATYPAARFEVLYPFDVNGTAFNRAINFPDAAWTPAALDCLKTEGLSLTFSRNLAGSEQGIGMGETLGFTSSQRAHLVGLGDSTAPWLKETRIAEGRKFESVVLFALDQFCLIGYELPFPVTGRRSVRMR
jgi:hypothetical protein